jgi:hypothetical protein
MKRRFDDEPTFKKVVANLLQKMKIPTNLNDASTILTKFKIIHNRKCTIII